MLACIYCNNCRLFFVIAFFSIHAKGTYIICKLIIVSACTVYLRDVVPFYLNKKGNEFFAGDITNQILKKKNPKVNVMFILSHYYFRYTARALWSLIGKPTR